MKIIASESQCHVAAAVHRRLIIGNKKHHFYHPPRREHYYYGKVWFTKKKKKKFFEVTPAFTFDANRFRDGRSGPNWSQLLLRALIFLRKKFFVSLVEIERLTVKSTRLLIRNDEMIGTCHFLTLINCRAKVTNTNSCLLEISYNDLSNFNHTILKTVFFFPLDSISCFQNWVFNNFWKNDAGLKIEHFLIRFWLLSKIKQRPLLQHIETLVNWWIQDYSSWFITRSRHIFLIFLTIINQAKISIFHWKNFNFSLPWNVLSQFCDGLQKSAKPSTQIFRDTSHRHSSHLNKIPPINTESNYYP